VPSIFSTIYITQSVLRQILMLITQIQVKQLRPTTKLEVRICRETLLLL